MMSLAWRLKKRKRYRKLRRDGAEMRWHADFKVWQSFAREHGMDDSKASYRRWRVIQARLTGHS